jgi:two-component system catabolic regulation response regulator CreB
MADQILIIEDEAAIADMLAYALKTDGYLPQHCVLGTEGLALLRQGAFSLVILDVGLPDMSGFEVCRQIRTFSDAPILFLTARAEEVDRIVGLEIGADDYVTKPFSPREVTARVRVILRRRVAAPVRQQDTWFDVDVEAARIHFCGTMLDLTRYEFLLLKHLLERPGRIYSREALMDYIWHDALDTSDRTVDTHIKTLRAKLNEVRADITPIITHRGMGYSAINSPAK